MVSFTESAFFIPEALIFSILALSISLKISNYIYLDEEIFWKVFLLFLTNLISILITISYFYFASEFPDIFNYLTASQKNNIVILQIVTNILLCFLLIYSRTNQSYSRT